MADIDQERADLNSLVRQAHEAIKDLAAMERRVDDRIREANKADVALAEAIRQIQLAIADITKLEIREEIARHVEGQIAAYDQAWIDAITKAQRKIYDRFDEIFNAIAPPTMQGLPKFPSLSQELMGGD